MKPQSVMTKTRYIHRNNKSPKEDTYLIALDIGYSSVKVFSPETVAIFPSYAVKDSGRGTAGTLSDDYIQYESLDTGEKWFVGKMAQDGLSDDDTSVSESSLYGRDRYRDPMYKVIVETGLGLACLHNENESYADKTICIETGLPPRYISKGSPDCAELTKILSGKHRFALTIGQRERRVFEIDVQAENIHIMPQPMGTLFSVAVDKEHAFVKDAAEYFNKNVLILDGGFGTLDFYPIKAHVIQKSETYDHLGMRRVLEEAATIIRDQYQKEISVPAMQKYLERGSFRFFEPATLTSRDEPLEDIITLCSQRVCNEAIDKMMQVYKLYEYDYLIVTGGTGAAWLEQIKDRLKNMSTLTVVNGAQNDTLPGVFANVRGYYMFRYSDIAARNGGA